MSFYKAPYLAVLGHQDFVSNTVRCYCFALRYRTVEFNVGSCQSYCTQPRHATQNKDLCCLYVRKLGKAPCQTQQKISARLKTACMISLLKHDLPHIFRPIICISLATLVMVGPRRVQLLLYTTSGAH